VKARGFVVIVVLLVCSAANADWHTAKKRCIFPYFQNGGNCVTIMVFVNSSEETADTLYIRFEEAHPPVPQKTWTFQLAPRDMFVASTSPGIGEWLGVVSSWGYVMWRGEEGDSLRGICAIYNFASGSGFIVPSYDQDHGF